MPWIELFLQRNGRIHNTNLLVEYRDHNDGEEYDETICDKDALECITGNESQDAYQEDHKDDIDTDLADSDCEDDVDDDFVSRLVMSDDEIDVHDDDNDIMNLVEEEEDHEYVDEEGDDGHDREWMRGLPNLVYVVRNIVVGMPWLSMASYI